DRRAWQRVDRLGAPLHHRTLGDNLQWLMVSHDMLNVRDVVAASYVVFARHLPVNYQLAASSGRVVDGQPFAGEQSLMQGHEKPGGVDRRDDGHVQRGLLQPAAGGGTSSR